MIDGHLSSAVPVTSGVPQGSILGPLLFNIYMNSISKLQLSPNARLVLYADDILLFKPIDNAKDKEDFQNDLSLISDWIQQHGLHINHLKTQLLPISRCKNIPPLSITVIGHVIPPSSEVKYLGVTLTSSLSWNQHISNVTKATKQLLGRVHRKFRGAPRHLRHKIYQTTVLPKLDYCSSVWDPHQQSCINQLEQVQKFAGKVIMQDWASDHHTTYASLNLHPLRLRRRAQKLKMTYKIINNHSCIPKSIFQLHPHPSPRSANSCQLYAPFASTNAYKYSFFIDVVSYWNSLPQDIVSSPSPNSFKTRLFRHLFC